MAFPSPGDLPDPGIKLRSPALHTDSLPSEAPGKPQSAEERSANTVAPRALIKKKLIAAGRGEQNPTPEEGAGAPAGPTAAGGQAGRPRRAQLQDQGMGAGLRLRFN